MRYVKQTDFPILYDRVAGHKKRLPMYSLGALLSEIRSFFSLLIFVFVNVPYRTLTIHGRLARMTNLVGSTWNKTGSERFFIFWQILDEFVTVVTDLPSLHLFLFFFLLVLASESQVSKQIYRHRLFRPLPFLSAVLSVRQFRHHFFTWYSITSNVVQLSVTIRDSSIP